jgi:signal transduction histidine kinase
MAMILNQERQLVYSNRALLQYLGLKDEQSIVGLRPGEILQCVHAFECEGGCGTTSFCGECGAVRAILSAQRGTQAVEECRVIRQPGQRPEALDLRVWATPLNLNDGPFTIFTVADISTEKRKQVLERTFFHDILNAAGALRGVAELMVETEEGAPGELTSMVYQLSEYLIEEIKTQRDLAAAEDNRLTTSYALISSLSLLQRVAQIYENHAVSRQRFVRIAPEATEVEFASDPVLLGRVLGNMVKNALEAVDVGQTVTLGCRVAGGEIEFWVHNPGVMPRSVQLQLFQRSFSTKGKGRGLGTYSMKLLSERYLQGAVSFTSTPETGTTFVGRYPLELKVDTEP